MKKLILSLMILTAFLPGISHSSDLYEIIIEFQSDLKLINNLNYTPVAITENGYLIICDRLAFEKSNRFSNIRLIKSDVYTEDLVLSLPTNGIENKIMPIYIDNKIALYDKISIVGLSKEYQNKAHPFREHEIKIEYIPDRKQPVSPANYPDGLDSVIAKVSQDSLESYLYRLEAFTHRLAGTDSNYAASIWIRDKFLEFGYDSVFLDPFEGSQLWDRHLVDCENIIAVKRGSVYPDKQIVISGHMDAVPDCPGADDDGSGTAGMIEIARVLSTMETDMTIVLIGFDSEESWMWGSYHYVDNAVARGDDIVLMINLDMIGHHNNNSYADIYHGPEDAFAYLWSELGDTFAGIHGDVSPSIASDHLPFEEAGYDVIFVQEKVFSTQYHLPTDNTSYINFEYMTRMVKASLATLWSVDKTPPPLNKFIVRQVGDGQSMYLSWDLLDANKIAEYKVIYRMENSPFILDTLEFDNMTSECFVEGLIEGVTYDFWIIPFDYSDNHAYASDFKSGTPLSKPDLPKYLYAAPVLHGVTLTWLNNNRELDFDRYTIFRDGQPIAEIIDTFYLDDDPIIGNDIHEYIVTATDTDNNISDTVGIVPVSMKAATLEPGRVLAVNRTNSVISSFVNETFTGQLMNDALDGYNYDFLNDSDYRRYDPNKSYLNIMEFIDYSLVLLSAEGATFDDLGDYPTQGGLLDTLKRYMDIGGRVIIFGRWGDIFSDYTEMIYPYLNREHTKIYRDYFHIYSRTITPTLFEDNNLNSDLIGVHSQYSGYPDMLWDSSRTESHSYPMTAYNGIPFVSYVTLNSSIPDIIYTYDSHSDTALSEGKTVGWRYDGDDYKYIYFEVPLSYFEYAQAKAVITNAVNDLLPLPTGVGDDQPNELPHDWQLAQNYPNPFNPTTVIEFSLPVKSKVELEIFNILGQRVSMLVDEELGAGRHKLEWNGSEFSTGIYLYRLKTDEFTAVRKMILIK